MENNLRKKPLKNNRPFKQSAMTKGLSANQRCKQAEAEMRESERKYRELADFLPEMVYEADEKGKIVFANRYAFKAFGYSQEDLDKGLNLFEMVIPEDRIRVIENLQGLLKGETLTNNEYTALRKDGSTFPIITNPNLIIRNNKLVGVRGVVIDMTDRKRVEESLRSERDKFRGMLLAISDGVDIINKDHIIEFQNELLKRRFGDRIGEKCYAAYMGLEEPCPFCSIQNAIKTGEATKVELLGKDGRNYELNSSPFTDMDGNVKVIELVRDITERKHAERVLQESEEKYRTILENIAEGYYEVDMAGNFTFFNDSVSRLLGYSKDELIGMNNRQYTDEENAKKLYQVFNKVYRTGDPTKVFDWEIIRKDGDKRFIEASVSLIRDSKGQTIGFRGIVRDVTEHKQAEEAVRTEKQRFQSLSENAPFGMVMIDKEGTFQYINPKFKELFGYDLTDIPDGRTWFRKAYPDPTYRHHVIGTWIKDLEDSKPEEKRSEVFAVACKDGTQKIINFIPVQLKTGENLMTCEDITERKQAEEALKESEKKFRVLTETAASGIFIHQGEKFIYVNPASEAMTGYTREELLGMNFWDLAHPDFQELVKQRSQGRQNGEDVPSRYELKIITKNGEERWIDLTAGVINFEGKPAVLGTDFDITEHKRAEKALKESEEKYRLLVENAGEAIFVAQDGMLKFANRKTTEMVGYSREDLISKHFMEFIHPDDQEMVLDRHRNRLQGMELPSIYPFRIINKSGEVKWVELNTVVITWEGRPATLNFLSDITGRKKAEDEMATLQEQLRQSQKMEAIGQLAGGIAHDFNNLLTVIKGYSQLSLLELNEGDPLQGNIQEIERSTERATDLTRQLLAFSRRQILDLKVIDLNTLLQDLNKMLHRILGEDITLFTLLSEDLGRVKVDPGQIEQVILNLAINARDAMLNGGKLTLETANVELDEEYAQTHIGVTPGGYVRLSVSDTGSGMSKEVQEKVFEPFFTTKEKGKGTGLGLSTVYGIVKQIGGNIWIYSEPGHGTTFKIYIPRVEEELDVFQLKDDTDSLPRGNEAVLLVEDEPSVRSLAYRLLCQQGYTVLEAADGDEALRLAQKRDGEKIDLLLTDVVMPQMSGKELAGRLKALKPHLKVLFTSGYTENAIVHHGVLAPDTHFIQKPFSPKDLSYKVREVLDR